MGFKYTDAAFRCRKARGLDKLVLLVICERANKANGELCWPSLRTIAADAGISVGKAHKSVKALETLELVGNSPWAPAQKQQVQADP